MGVDAAQEFGALVRSELGDDVTSAQAALAWCVAQPGVSSVIPGASRPEQARGNAAADGVEVTDGFLAGVRDLYDRRIRELVHDRW